METTYDTAYGMPTAIDDLGDLATTEDDRCTRIEYIRNQMRHIMGTVRRSETVAKACSAGVVRPADVIEETRTSYDGAYNVAPTRGLVTETRRLSGHDNEGAAEFIREARSTYDAYGRVLPRRCTCPADKNSPPQQTVR